MRLDTSNLDNLDWIALGLFKGVLATSLFPELLVQPSGPGNFTPGANLPLESQKIILYSLMAPDLATWELWARVTLLSPDERALLAKPVRDHFQ